MRILIFGATGYIGSEFVKQLDGTGGDLALFTAKSRNVDGTPYTFFELIKVINQYMPTHIINCSAYIGKTSVVDCENNKDQTILSNVMFPSMLGQICRCKGIILGHLSSGCVFNGYTAEGWKEDDEVHLSFKKKCSFYTGTKVMAEDALKHVEKKYIWRIRLPFDNIPSPRNYLSKIMSFDKLLLAENSLSNRQDVVSACIACILKGIPYGTYHVVNPGGISPTEIVKLLKEHGSKKEYQYLSDEELEQRTQIPRSNTVLNVEKLERQGIYLPSTRESVEDAIKNWQGVIS